MLIILLKIKNKNFINVKMLKKCYKFRVKYNIIQEELFYKVWVIIEDIFSND